MSFMNLRDDTMVDLTLYEYEGCSEEELEQILQSEVINIFNSNFSKNGFGRTYKSLNSPLQHKSIDFIFLYWERIINFIYSKVPKILLNFTRIDS